MYFFNSGKRQLPEDDNPTFQFEEKHASSNVSREFSNSTDSRCKQKIQKLHHWKSEEDNMFSSDRCYIQRGKSVEMPLYRFTQNCSVEGLWHQEWSKKLDSGYSEIFDKTARDFSGQKYSKFVENKGASDAYFRILRGKDIGARQERDSIPGKSISCIRGFQNVLKENRSNLFLAESSAYEQPMDFSFQSPCTTHVRNSESGRHNALNVPGINSQHNLVFKPNSVSICSSVDNDEFCQQKKPWLGWGEGLAKYENQNVDAVDDNSDKKGFRVSYVVGPNVESWRKDTVLAKRECTLSEHLYPFTSISLPDEHVMPFGVGSCESVLSGKVWNEITSTLKHGDYFKGFSNLEGTLPLYLSQITDGGFSLDTDFVDCKPFASTKSKAVETFQVGVPSERLLSLKHEILQKLDGIDCEFDRLERELRCLNSEFQTKDCHFEVEDSFGIARYCSHENLTEVDEKNMGASLAGGHQMHSEVHLNKGRIVVPLHDREATNEGIADEYFRVQSIECEIMGTEHSGTVTRCFISQSVEQLDPAGFKEVAVKREDEAVEEQSITAEGPILSSCINYNPSVTCQSSFNVDCSLFNPLVTNCDLSKVAPQLILKFLHTIPVSYRCLFFSEISDTSVWKQNAEMHERNKKQMEQKILEHRHFMTFKEQFLALKFRVLRKWWKEGRHTSSTRKDHEECYQFDDFFHCGYQSHRPYYQGQSTLSGAKVLTSTSDEGEMGLVIHPSSYRDVLKMPAMTLHDNRRHIFRFMTSNGLIEDPVAFEKERDMINPWTAKEKEIFWEKFAIFSKNFGMVASFLRHKTVADCVEFYYKNHKKRHDLKKRKKDSSTGTYLSTPGKRRPRLIFATSLDVLGAVVALTMDGMDLEKRDHDMLHKHPGTQKIDTRLDLWKTVGKFNYEPIIDDNFVNSERMSSAAADVLPGPCAFVTSTAMDSCKSYSYTSLDPPFTSESDFEACDSVEECCKGINTDWTDDEKWLFINALSKYGKDFGRISFHVHSKSENQCRIFFCKARKSLRLDDIMGNQ